MAIDVPADTAAASLSRLALQARVSIALRIAPDDTLRVRAIKGSMTPDEALSRLLKGSGLRARRVAPGVYIVDRPPAPVPPPPARRAAPVPTAMPPAAPGPDIVILATKRAVPLRYHAGSVQVIAGDALSPGERGAGSDAIEAQSSSVTSTHLGPGRNKLFIRGIADSSVVGPTETTVGQYWGEQRITYGAPDPSLRLYDIDHVEILEGPQGTLYGAGSLGGLVRVEPRRPDLSHAGGSLWSGLSATASGAPGLETGAVVNLPLPQLDAALRAVAYGQVEGGYIDDARRGRSDVNRIVTGGARLAARIEPAAGWRVNLQGLWQRIAGRDAQYADRPDSLVRSAPFAEPFRNDYRLASIAAEHDAGALRLTAAAGHVRQSVSDGFVGPDDADGAPTRLGEALRIDLTTLDLRLARPGRNGAGWVAGVSLLQSIAHIAHDQATGEIPDGAATPIAELRNRVRDATVYGDYGIAVTRRLTLSAGLRLSNTRLSGGLRRAAIGTTTEDEDIGVAGVRSETRLLPAASIAYRPADRWTVTARIAQGFRPGGLTLRQNYVQHFDGDRMTTVEGGVRYAAPRFDAAATIARSRWRDVQADTVDALGFSGTANLGDARILSIGGNARWRPLAGLDLALSSVWNDGRIVAPTFAVLPFGIESLEEDDRLPNLVRLNGRFAIAYAFDLAPGTHVGVSGSARYIGASRLGVGTILGRYQGDYVDTALDLRLDRGRGHWSLGATNLLDSRGNRFALGSPYTVRDQRQFTPQRPLTIRLGYAVDM